MKMKTTLLIWLCFVNLSLAEDVVIESFDNHGRLTFHERSDAIEYRIEWSPGLSDQWTNFSDATISQLNRIPAVGVGAVTVLLPISYRVVASLAPHNMQYVPQGAFVMGNATNIFSESEGSLDELPQHIVYLDAFFIDKYEVTQTLWAEVFNNGIGRGYEFSNSISYVSSERPIRDVTWFDAVRWCNARSEMDGLKPVYYIDIELTNIYKAGESIPYPDWSANGYRLPTEAEWEKAARGGVADTRFPWSNYTNRISHAKANYMAAYSSYDLSSGFHPHFYNQGWMSPVGYFPPNDYGIHEMAGNAMEWCWDWMDQSYYESSPGVNPKGPSSGSFRVVRGGGSSYGAEYARCSARAYELPIIPSFEIGIRCVRRW